MSTIKTKNGLELKLINLKGKEYLPAQQRVMWFRDECLSWTIEVDLVTHTDKLAIAKATIKNHEGRIIAQDYKSETPQGFADFIEKASTGAVARALALCGFGTQFALELDEGTDVADSPQERQISRPNQFIGSGNSSVGGTTTPPIYPPKPKGPTLADTAKDFAEFNKSINEPPWPSEEPPMPEQEMMPAPKIPNMAPGALKMPKGIAGEYVIGFGKYKGTKVKDMDPSAALNYVQFLKGSSAKDGKPLSKGAEEAITAISQHLNESDVIPF